MLRSRKKWSKNGQNAMERVQKKLEEKYKDLIS